MKKIAILLFTLSSGLLLSGCTDTVLSETGYDLTALEVCIDDMVDQNTNTACDATSRDTLLEEYVRSFESQFDTTGANYVDTQIDYSTSKDGTIERIEFWFQYNLLPADQAETDYEVFKEIFQTMATELRAMNDVPELIFSGEFMFEGHLIYKYHHDQNDQISGEILYIEIIDTLETTYTSLESLITTYSHDDELLLHTYTITGVDHSIKIYIHPADDTYSYDVYYSAQDAVMTVTEVGTMIETTFASTTLTLITE